MIDLTEEQRQELDSGGLVRIRDPRTEKTYVLVQEDVYARVQQLSGETLPADTYPAVDAVFRADWDRPDMAQDDHYEEHKP